MDEQALQKIRHAVEIDLIVGVVRTEDPTYMPEYERLTPEKILELFELANGNESGVMDEQTLEALHRLAEIDRMVGVILADDATYDFQRLTPEKVREWVTIAYDYERRQVDEPGQQVLRNPVVSWEPGEPKAPTYDSFTVVNNRKLDQDSIDDAVDCADRIWWARWRHALRWLRDSGVVTVNEARTEMGMPRVEMGVDPVKWPSVPDPAPGWTLVSDVRLEGEEAAQALGLDDEWRAILGMWPQPARALDEVTWEQLKRAVGIELIAETFLMTDALSELPEEFRLTPEQARTLAERGYDEAIKTEDDSKGA